METTRETDKTRETKRGCRNREGEIRGGDTGRESETERDEREEREKGGCEQEETERKKKGRARCLTSMQSTCMNLRSMNLGENK